MSIHGFVFVSVPIFSSFGHKPKSKVAGSYNNSMFNFLRNHKVIISKAFISVPTKYRQYYTQGDVHIH